jgi:pimeloyl-ACP methyl ester carboxylesterase
MRGRVINLFHKPYEFTLLDKGTNLNLKDFEDSVIPDEKRAAERDGGLAVFLQQLQAYQEHHPERRIVLVGHSAGTIVASEMLARYPKIKYSHIVYMAAACSINDLEKSVLPYLQLHCTDPVPTRFYDLCLHPQHEVDEWRLQQVTLSNGFEEFVAERGSLLEWIDNFYSTPESFMDRMLGKWENIIQAAHIIPCNLRPLITIKGFGADANAIKVQPNLKTKYDVDLFYEHRVSGPQAHGDFSWWPYWKSWMWEVDAPPAATSEDSQ